MRIALTPQMVVRAARIAAARNDKPIHVNRRFHPETTDFDAHLMGALAEVAWEKWKGWPVDSESRPDGDGGIDFEREGKTYQIKARNLARYPLPDLLCRPDYAKADFFILAEVNMENAEWVRMAGWCEGWRLRAAPSINLGYGDRLIIKREELRKWTGKSTKKNERN
jgi:hypothetical protein